MGFLTKKASGNVAAAGADAKRKQFARMESGGLTRANTDLGEMLIDEPPMRNKGAKGKTMVGFEDQPSPPQRGPNAFDYGARKRNPMSAADKKDKIIEFERENNTLKEKENFLHQEVKLLTTKLHRVEHLIRQRARNADEAGDYDMTDMQRDLRGECNDLREKNDEIKDRVRKLNVI